MKTKLFSLLIVLALCLVSCGKNSIAEEDQSGITDEPYKIVTPTQEETYNNITTTTQTETKSVRWYGYVKDGAGHTYKCESTTIKVDKTAPTTPTTGRLEVLSTMRLTLKNERNEKNLSCKGRKTKS